MPDTEARVSADDLRSQAQRYRDTADTLDRAADAIEGCDHAPGVNVLGGRKLTDAVDRVMEPGETAHYRTILARLRESDVEPRGANPANTLLSALNRSPYYSRVGSRTGEYRRHQPEDEPATQEDDDA